MLEIVIGTKLVEQSRFVCVIVKEWLSVRPSDAKHSMQTVVEYPSIFD